MSIYSPKSNGIGYAPAYQVAGKPYLTGSLIEAEDAGNIYSRREYKVTFPSVTRYVKVTNNCTSSEIAVYFSPREVAGQCGPLLNGQYFVIPAANYGITGSFEANIKCKELFIVAAPFSGLTGSILQPTSVQAVNAGAFGVFAELTHISPGEMYPLTGSGINAPNFPDGHH
jgi:hypothetical protein